MNLLEPWWDLVLARCALWLLPWRAVPGAIARAAAPRLGREDAPAALARAVRSAARAVPRASCLVQALALHAMLDRRRRRSDLKLGVRRNPGFEAHAWLEVDGAIVIGEHRDGSGYEPMPRVSPRSEVPRNGVPRN